MAIEFVAADERPATCYQTENFLIGKIDKEDDYRIGCVGSDGEIAKWAFPGGFDVGFERSDLEELYALLGRVLAPTSSGGSEVTDA